MVLMAMGDNDAAQLFCVLQNIRIIREDKVYARMVIIREHEAGINKDDVILKLKDGHILADVIQAAKWDYLELPGIGLWRFVLLLLLRLCL